ncbi:MAG: putative porin, partial [Rudanella sp.]|nr:putative porin [Rudanella sp.]
MTAFSFFARLVFLISFCLSTALFNQAVLAQGFPGSTLPGRAGGFGGQTGGRPGASGSSSTGRGSIDDSTKVIYGPRTTRYYLEADVLNNRKTLFTTDTLLDGVHLYNFVQRNGNLYQDLGNLGTALRPVFYQEPTQIGAQTGYSVFLPYAYQQSQIKYYDTKSPFTRMYFVLGGRNQNVLNFDYSQNINPRFNVGFNAQRVTSRKQFGAQTLTASSNDIFLAQSWAFVGHMNYRTKDEKYTLLAHFNHLNHDIPEQGGVLPNPRADGTLDQFYYEGNPYLGRADGKELRNMWHLYQQYKLAEGFQLFHRLDYLRQINSFNDYRLQTDSTLTRFYPKIDRSQYPD